MAAAQIVTSVPLAPALLAPLLASSIPHRLRDRDTQCLYLRALFVVAAQPVQTSSLHIENI
jgi:RNA polymerase I-specific transcription initiation factor RRN3